LKKYFPYIIAFVIAGAIIALLFTGKRNGSKVFDQRITLRKQDKIPYGTYAAHQLLKGLLPNATIHQSRQEPGYWGDSITNSKDRQAYVFIGNRFTADEYEMKNLIRFAEKGNDVFISASYISAAADDAIKCNSSSVSSNFSNFFELQDSMTTVLNSPFVQSDSSYTYPGLTFNSYFSSVDTNTTDILGTDKSGKPLFIHLAAGEGHIFLHLEPLAFSNYFILYKNNIDYFEKAFSVIHPATNKIIWDEYFVAKQSSDQNNKNNRTGWFKTLMNMQNSEGQKPFKWAFWLFILLLLLFVLMEMRRKQRYIPFVKPPKNDSLDFVKTIGRLYYDKGDHKNLCRKMAAYFLEHVRAVYKIPTNLLDDKFIRTLQYKSDATEFEIRSIVSFIKFMDDGGMVGKEQLISFHQELESFYKKA
jgi:hypothetical protein